MLLGIDAATLLAVPALSHEICEITAFSEELLWERLLNDAKHVREEDMCSSARPLFADGSPFTELDYGDALTGGKHRFLRCHFIEIFFALFLPPLPAIAVDCCPIAVDCHPIALIGTKY